MPNESHAGARNSDPSTSHAAARKARKANYSSLVLELIRLSSTPVTTHSLVRLSGVPWSTISPRLAPLFDKGLIEYSGTKVDDCIAYVAVPPERVEEARLRNLAIRAERNKGKESKTKQKIIHLRLLLERADKFLACGVSSLTSEEWGKLYALREEIKSELS